MFRQIITNDLVEPWPSTPRPPMMVPPGLTNLALGAKVACSDTNIPAQTLAKLNDGDKETPDSAILLLHKGVQWVQLDLGAPHELYAVAIWHDLEPPGMRFHDVIVQLSNDVEFTSGVQTVFNNDRDNSSGRGVGADPEYYETCAGKLVDGKGIKARYVRCYSKGSTDSKLNCYLEVEVYGRPAR